MARPNARRALLSVSDKTGIVELARELRELDFELISTGGTARMIAAAGLPGIITPAQAARSSTPGASAKRHTGLFR